MIVGIQILQPIPSKSGFNRVTRLYIGGYKIVANFFGLSAKFLADNAESAVLKILIMKVDSQKVVTKLCH